MMLKKVDLCLSFFFSYFFLSSSDSFISCRIHNSAAEPKRNILDIVVEEVFLGSNFSCLNFQMFWAVCSQFSACVFSPFAFLLFLIVI